MSAYEIFVSIEKKLLALINSSELIIYYCSPNFELITVKYMTSYDLRKEIGKFKRKDLTVRFSEIVENFFENYKREES